MSFNPGQKNFSVWRGGTFRKVLVMHQGDASSPLYNLTGYTGRMRLRDQTGVTLSTLTTENGGIILGGTAGTITLLMSAAATAITTWDVALYELFLIAPNGDADAILYGALRLTGAG